MFYCQGPTRYPLSVELQLGISYLNNLDLLKVFAIKASYLRDSNCQDKTLLNKLPFSILPHTISSLLYITFFWCHSINHYRIMLSNVDIALRVVSFTYLSIALSFSASLAATTIYHHNSQVNYCIFAAAWGLLTSGFYGLVAYFISYLASPIFLTILDFLNFAFTFAGATALAAAIRSHSCSNKTYLNSNKVTQGSEIRCRKAKVDVAFLYFSAFIFLGSLVLQVINVKRNGFFGTSEFKRSNAGVPTMAQV